MSAVDFAPFRRLIVRTSTLLFVCVLLCVPGLTRAGQHVSTTQGPTLSFAKSTDFPPKKITIEHVSLIVSWSELTCADSDVRVFVRPIDTTPPPAFPGFAPRPLRAPPVTALS